MIDRWDVLAFVGVVVMAAGLALVNPWLLLVMAGAGVVIISVVVGR